MTTVFTVKADITTYKSDVIVNAANSSLLGGGGVDGAIHRAAGKELLFACRLLNGAKTGEAKMTDAFEMSTASKIVHTVGPVYKGHNKEEAALLLRACYQNSLALAKDFKSIAFPAISTGIYGYPLEEATNVALTAIYDWLAVNPNTSLEEIVLIAFNEKEYEVISEQVMNLLDDIEIAKIVRERISNSNGESTSLEELATKFGIDLEDH